jgi:hypothetical protein
MPSKAETSALRPVRVLYAATGGRPQQWRMLASLGATEADAAGIAYAVEKDWLLIESEHSVCLTDVGRRKVRPYPLGGRCR